jgi:NAD(P)-dependent dehydrogenase (short-subunit alcohol dehydrogenase family)
VTFQDLNIAIFGAYGGIGKALANSLKSKNANLFLCGRNSEKIQTLAQELESPFQVCDASDFSSTEDAINNCVATYGRLDGVVNCCGSLLLKPAHISSEADFNNVINCSLKTSFSICKHASRAMMEHGGSVVFISSAAANIGLPNHEGIAAAKAAVQGLAISAAASYAPKRIRFNVVAPGLVETPLTSNITKNPSALNASISMHPLGKIGQPSDIVSAIEFFLNRDNSWITGQILAVDGGLSSMKSRP